MNNKNVEKLTGNLFEINLDNIEKQIEQLKNKSPEIQKSIVLNIAFEIFANPNLEYKKVKSILDKIRKNVKNKEIIEIITTNELSWLLETPNNEKLNKSYLNKLLNNLSEPIKKYYEALVANYYNDYQTYFKKLEEAALKNVKPAISKYIDLLYENLEKIENKKLLEKNFLKLSKALDNPGLMGDYYFEIGDYKNSEKYYLQGIEKGDKNCYFALIGLYVEEFKKFPKQEKLLDKKVLNYINYIENNFDLSEYEYFKLYYTKGHYYLNKNDKEKSLDFFEQAILIASELQLYEEYEKIAKIIFYYFSDIVGEIYLDELLIELIHINPLNKTLLPEYFNKINNNVGELVSAIDIFYKLKEPSYLLNFLNNYIKENIKKLQYNDIKNITDTRKIKKDIPNFELNNKNLLNIILFDNKYLSKNKINKKLEKLAKEDNLLTEISIKLAKNGDIEKKEITKLNKLGLTNKKNIDENDLENIVTNLEKKIKYLVNILNALEVKEDILLFIKGIKTLQLYDIFRLFNLTEPKEQDFLEEVNYFNKLNKIYDLTESIGKLIGLNLGAYSFYKNIILKGFEGKTKEELEEFFKKAEISILTGKENIDYEKQILPKEILETLFKILKYENLSKKDEEILELILSGDLKENEKISFINKISKNNKEINGNTKFINLGDKIIKIN